MSKLEQAQVALEQGNVDFAQRILAELLIEEPENVDGWLLLSSYVSDEQAMDSLERVLSIQPEHPVALERLASLRKPPAQEGILGEGSSGVYDFSDIQLLLEEDDEGSNQEQNNTPIVDENILNETQIEEEESVAPNQKDLILDDIKPNQESQGFDFVKPELVEKQNPESEAWEEPKRQKRKVKSKGKATRWFANPVVSVLLVLLGLCIFTTSGFYWYYQEGPCGMQRVGKTYLAMNEIISQWDDSLTIATKSSRVVITEPLLRMVDLRRTLRKMEIPACMRTVREDLDNSMALTLDAYDKFLRYEGEKEIIKRFNQAALLRKMYERRLQEVYACAPFSCPE